MDFEKVNEQIEKTDASITKLEKASLDIGESTKMINSIAKQTNMLALNAKIEAARAGSAGKGFAVVAMEVKELANQATKAAEAISKRIEVIQMDTKEAKVSIDQLARDIRESHLPV